MIILAVRFSNERDLQKLFALLASNGKVVERLSRSLEHSTRIPSPPPWYMLMGRDEQLNVRALALNTSQEYINNMVVLNKLAADYNLTPEQLREAVTYFQLGFSPQRNSQTWQYPRVSLSPSFSNGGQISPALLNAARNPSWRFDHKSPNSSTRISWNSAMDRSGLYPMPNEDPSRRSRLYAEMNKLQGSLQKIHSTPLSAMRGARRRSSSRYLMNSSRSAISPSQSVHQVQALPLPHDQKRNITQVCSTHRSSGFLEQSGTLPLNANHYRYPTAETLLKASGLQPGMTSGFSTPEHNERKSVTVPHTPQTDLPTIPEAKKPRRRSGRQSQKSHHDLLHPEENVGDAVISSPLTKKNLALYNEQVPPLKGNYRKIVRSWFRKYFLPNADSNGLISDG